MALSLTSIGNYLFKRAQSKSSTNDTRQFFEETFDGRAPVIPAQIWAQADQIPLTAPSLADQVTSGVLKRYVQLSLTAVPGTTNAFQSDSLRNCVPFNFATDGSYNYQLFDSTGTAIPFGQGDWLVDPAVGTLTFYSAVPGNMPPKISFYQYVGTVGMVAINPQSLTFQQIATPPVAPASGYQTVFIGTDGKMKTIDSTGAIKALGGGAGGTGKNYLADLYDGSSVTGLNLFGSADASYAFDSSLNRVDLTGDAINYPSAAPFYTGQAVTYTAGTTAIGGLTTATIYYVVRISASVFGLALTQANANAKTLIDLTSQGAGTQTFAFAAAGGAGTGGGSTANLVIQQSQFPLRASGSQRIGKGAVSKLGAGVSFDFAPDAADTEGAKIMKVAFKYKHLSSLYQSGDLTVSLLDLTNNQIIPLDGNLVTPIPFAATTSVFQTLFYATPGTQYRLKFEVATANTNSWVFDFVDCELGLIGGSVPGAIVTEWVNGGVNLISAITTAPTKGTTTIDRCFYRRVGGDLEVRIEYVQTAAGAAGSGDYLWEIPNKLVADLTRASVFTAPATAIPINNALGTATVSTTSPAAGGSGVVALYDATRVRLLVTLTNANTTFRSVASDFANIGLSGVSMNATYRVPIAGWSAGASYSTTELVLKNQPFATTSATKTMVAQGNQALSGNSLTLPQGLYDLDVLIDGGNNGSSPAYLEFSVGLTASNGADSTAAVPFVTTLPGVTLFGNYFANNNPLNSMVLTNATLRTTIKLAQTTTIFAIAYVRATTPANARITAYFTANKRPEFSAFGVNGTNQLIEAKSGTQILFPVAANTWADLASIVVPPGEWDIDANYLEAGTASSAVANVYYLLIGTVAGNNSTGLIYGTNAAGAPNGVGTGIGWVAHPAVNRYNVVLTQTTTFYLKCMGVNSTAGTSINGYRISARRIR